MSAGPKPGPSPSKINRCEFPEIRYQTVPPANLPPTVNLVGVPEQSQSPPRRGPVGGLPLVPRGKAVNVEKGGLSEQSDSCATAQELGQFRL